jgi:small-conductance mechanosensitive channel
MSPREKVYRVHRALALLYGGLTALMLFVGLQASTTQRGLGPIIGGALIISLLFALHVAVAIGAKRQRSWSRTASQVIACIMLVGFPLGTLIGVYLLANTWRPWQSEPVGAAAGM